MSIVSNHFPEVLADLNRDEDLIDITATEGWADFDRDLAERETNSFERGWEAGKASAISEFTALAASIEDRAGYVEPARAEAFRVAAEMLRTELKRLSK